MAHKKKDKVPFEELSAEDAYILDYVRRNIEEIEIPIPSRTIEDSHQITNDNNPREGFYFEGH